MFFKRKKHDDSSKKTSIVQSIPISEDLAKHAEERVKKDIEYYESEEREKSLQQKGGNQSLFKLFSNLFFKKNKKCDGSLNKAHKIQIIPADEGLAINAKKRAKEERDALEESKKSLQRTKD